MSFHFKWKSVVTCCVTVAVTLSFSMSVHAACGQHYTPYVISPTTPPELVLFFDPVNPTASSSHIDGIDVIYGEATPSSLAECGEMAIVSGMSGVGISLSSVGYPTTLVAPAYTSAGWPGGDSAITSNEINDGYPDGGGFHILNYVSVGVDYMNPAQSFPSFGTLAFGTWGGETSCNSTTVSSYESTCNPYFWLWFNITLRSRPAEASLPVLFL
jgi:hypothetical protein